ncbi:MAG: flagellar biosynthetic protein FliO [Rhodoferax sp.]|nr:flagellar biosynthetic protein FliO [Rhodoferax sp.]
MTQSLILIGLFLCVLVSLPFLIERLKKHYGLNIAGPSGTARLVSALALGPQQKVVTVEVGPHNARVWLVLGVTQQSIQCLHTMPADTTAAAAVAATTLVAQQTP